MDVCSVIKTRLVELGLEQKDLAAAAEVTESYVSQLLTRKKLPPAPERTDIYEKMGRFLKLSNGELAKLARAQRLDELRRDYEEPQGALLKESRELILRKCVPARQPQIREIFREAAVRRTRATRYPKATRCHTPSCTRRIRQRGLAQ